MWYSMAWWTGNACVYSGLLHGLLWPAVALPWPAASPCLALCLSFSLLLLPLWLLALPSSGVVSDADGK